MEGANLSGRVVRSSQPPLLTLPGIPRSSAALRPLACKALQLVHAVRVLLNPAHRHALQSGQQQASAQAEWQQCQACVTAPPTPCRHSTTPGGWHGTTHVPNLPGGVQEDGQRRPVAIISLLKCRHERLVDAPAAIVAHIHCEFESQSLQHPHCRQKVPGGRGRVSRITPGCATASTRLLQPGHGASAGEAQCGRGVKSALSKLFPAATHWAPPTGPASAPPCRTSGCRQTRRSSGNTWDGNSESDK